MNTSTLDSRFGLGDELRFEAGPGGLPQAVISNALAEATVSLYGGHVLTWRPTGADPVLWVSAHRYAEEGKPIRGGVPVCWPWFGPHPSSDDAPAHGVARTALWSVAETGRDEAGTHLALAFETSPSTTPLWPRATKLRLDVFVGRSLQVSLTTQNSSDETIEISQALHTYLGVSDVRHVRIEGLDGREYIDQLDPGGRKRQAGDVTITEETDRIYVGTEDTCILHDPGLDRRIRIVKAGSRSTVVWNPWIEKSQRMVDFGDDEYPRMLCIETTNAADDAVRIAPGEEHTLAARVEVD